MIDVKIARSDRERDDAFYVRKKVFVDEQGVPITLEIDEYDQTANHFIVYIDENPIGAGRIREINKGIAKVERVCILQEFRGKHLGSLIMEELEKYARSENMTKIVLNAQSYAVPFYEKLGYVVTSPEFMDADIPHRAMEKEIN
ncbi:MULTISPECIES: GNAT family N-acetyltransferase [Sporosarcina]|uniref:GNAT family N-acetyltransferase n=1 Tax=Sporosarcina saromensis TaxID=359365 RepID=A0ABU4G6Z7_9BACL|nr:GNAT family N-acetyltransferase [Sporosarcina saromensis]MDW0112691.1 GNAT family N-acetyltransferase [Sporosarcina saromensis]